uniref:Uncharacterized protein n=1 Tax=Helianthus annuus TaxID=4232 RepID=A0A251UW30_HELAN
MEIEKPIAVAVVVVLAAHQFKTRPNRLLHQQCLQPVSWQLLVISASTKGKESCCQRPLLSLSLCNLLPSLSLNTITLRPLVLCARVG